MMINAKITDVEKFKTLILALIEYQSTVRLSTRDSSINGVLARYKTELVSQRTNPDSSSHLVMSDLGFELSFPRGSDFKSLKITFIDKDSNSVQQRTTCKSLDTLKTLLAEQIAVMPNGIDFVFHWLNSILSGITGASTVVFRLNAVDLFFVGNYCEGRAVHPTELALAKEGGNPYFFNLPPGIPASKKIRHEGPEQTVAAVMNHFGVEGSVSRTIRLNKEHLTILADTYLKALIDPSNIRRDTIESAYKNDLQIDILINRDPAKGEQFQIEKPTNTDKLVIIVFPLPYVRLYFTEANTHALKFLTAFVEKMRLWYTLESDIDLNDLKSILLG